MHCGMQRYKTFCQTEGLFRCLALQETIWNKTCEIVCLFIQSHGPILDTICTFACKFKSPNHPESANMEYTVLKQPFAVRTRLRLHEIVFSSSLLTQRWLSYLKQKHVPTACI